MMPKITIAVLNYNSDEYTIKCIASIKEHTKLPASDFEIVILDNGSKEFDHSVYESYGENIRTIRLEKNTGFGGGNNYAVKDAESKYLFFLNNDTMMLNDVITELWDFMEAHPDCVICGAQQYDGELRKVRSYNFYPHLFHRVYRIGLLKIFYEWKYKTGRVNFQAPFEADVASGADLFIRDDFFRSIGGFDEGYFLYHEEEDLAIQARKQGKRIFIVPQAKLVHYLSKSSPEKLYVYKEDAISLIRYYKKHRNLLSQIVLRGLLLMKFCQRTIKNKLKSILNNKYKLQAKIYTGLLLWGLSGFPSKKSLRYSNND